MKKISNFTQTYQGTPEWSPGSDCKSRDFLIEAFIKDQNKIECYKLLDHITFNFHNFNNDKDKELYKKIKTVLPNVVGFSYKNMTLGKSIYLHINQLKKEGITDFLWVQDDEFFTHEKFEDFEKIFNFYKENDDIKNLSLKYNIENVGNISPIKKYNLSDNIKINEYNTTQLTDMGYCMDFTAFICNIDYFLNNMFDESFNNIRDAYALEGAMMRKSLDNKIQRCFTNIIFFGSFNIVGMGGSLANSETSMKKLKEMYLDK